MQPTLKSETIYVTLTTAGAGSVQFTARKALTLTKVTKVTVEMTVTSSGRVVLSKVGTFLTSMPVAPKMEAIGSEGLYPSEYLTLTIENGPNGAVVAVRFFYIEEPINP